MTLAEPVLRVVEPALLRFCQWRGDPVARWMLPETKADPYPLYDDIRDRGLVRSALGPYVTASHPIAEAVLGDPRFSSSPVHTSGCYPPASPDSDPGPGLLALDQPGHAHIRRLVAGAFTPSAADRLEPRIRDIAARLLDAAGDGGFDVVGALAFPLSIAVTCALLGVPPEDQALFRGWGHDVVSAVEPRTRREADAGSHSAELALAAYLKDLVAVRRAAPDDSLLSALITAADGDGGPLSTGELVSVALMLAAGFETTVNLIGNGVAALLAEPSSPWERLAAAPELIPGAVEEILRYDSPVQLITRIAARDLEVAGTELTPGSQVMVAIGGANRDPEVFGDPGELRVDRADAARHLSFSPGDHHCLGGRLARLEARVALEELTRRHPRLRLAGPPARRPQLALRGFESVPVR